MIKIPTASRFALISNRFQELILIVIVIRGFSSTSSSKSRITIRTKTSVGRTKKRTHFPEDPANNSAAEIRTKRLADGEKARERERIGLVLRAVSLN